MRLAEINYYQWIFLRQCSYDVIITPTTTEKPACCFRQLSRYSNYSTSSKAKEFSFSSGMSCKCFYSPDRPDRHWRPAITNGVLFRIAYSCWSVELITPAPSVENKHERRFFYSHPFPSMQYKRTTLHLLYLQRTSVYTKFRIVIGVR
jgi:hypothetical protein